MSSNETFLDKRRVGESSSRPYPEVAPLGRHHADTILPGMGRTQDATFLASSRRAAAGSAQCRSMAFAVRPSIAATVTSGMGLDAARQDVADEHRVVGGSPWLVQAL